MDVLKCGSTYMAVVINNVDNPVENLLLVP
jgi:hypothetical protein